MDVSESARSRSKRDLEERTNAREGRIEDDGDWDGSDKRKHRTSKSRKHSNVEESEEQDSSRRRSSDGRKKSDSSSRAGSGDDDDYDVKRESRSKIPKKNPEERGEMRELDFESSRKNRDEEQELNSSRKTSTKPSGHDSSQGKSRSKGESLHERELQKGLEKDSKYSEKKETSSREKGNPPRRRWDDPETGRRADDSGKVSDHNKHGTTRERALDSRNESGEARSSRIVDSSGEKGVRSGNREEKRANGERSRGRSEAQDEDNRAVSTPREARDDKQRKARERSEDIEPSAHRYSAKSYGEKSEKHRRDEVESRERSVNMDEDGHGRMRDRNGREIRHTKRSRTPERSGRHHREMDDHDRGFSESDTERSISIKGREREKEGYRDDRSSKGKDSSWNDKNREREGSKDHWRSSHSRQDGKDGDNEFDARRRDQDRAAGYRKDTRIRSEGMKAGNIVDNSDSIEIRPNKNLDFGREESVSTLPARRAETGLQQDSGAASDEEWGYPPEDRSKMAFGYGDDDDGSTVEQNSGRNSLDSQAGKGRGQKVVMITNRTGAGQSPSSGLHPPFGNIQGSGAFNRALQQGQKGGRQTRGGRGRLSGRDAQRVGLPLPMMGPPFGHLGLPPGAMQSLGPNMAHSPGPPIGPGVFIPPFPGPLVWPGARGVDMNMLAVPPNLPPIPPPGPAGPRFLPNMTGPNHAIYFNQPGPGRGVPPNLSGPGFNSMGPIGREMPHDKPPVGWGQNRASGPSGKAPSRGEQNDYSQNFVDTGMRPQNFIRELELTSVVEDYPKLRELIQRKDEIVAKSSSPPMYYKCDLKENALSPEFFGTKFDVILVDPPWEEYVHRAPGVTDHLVYWTFEEIQNLKIEAIADTPSFIFLWVGDGVGLEQGRQCLKKWGFRRCEDICWVKTNKRNATPGLRHDSHTLFQHSKEHCLMGIKGTVRRSTDGHIIHANIDTDIIIAEEPTDGSTKKPDDMYRIIEHFALGRRRLELFGEDHNIRSGWLTVGRGLSSSNFNTEAYVRNFGDKDGKVWQGGGGRNPPPDAPHLVLTTPEIESLRPKSPPAKNQQQQQSISLMTTGSSSNRRPSGNSPQNTSGPPLSSMNQDGSVSEPGNPAPWASSPMGGIRSTEGGGGHGSSEDKFYDGYGFNPSCAQVVGDHIEFEPHRTLNMM